MLDMAMARGELDAGADVEYALDLMAAPVFWRICGLRRDTTPEYLDRVVDTVLHALGVHGHGVPGLLPPAAQGSVWALGGGAGALSADYYRDFAPDPDARA